MTRYLLDTNVISQALKRPNGQLAIRIEGLLASQICTSIIVAAELRFGVEKRPSPSREQSIETFLANIDVLSVEAPTDETYAVVRAQLEAAGTPIGANDLLIAAQALSLGLTLVTDNEREFRRVPGLAVENWLRE